MSRIILFTLLALLVAGCSPSATAPARVTASEREWSMIRMTQSGGIMGLSRSIKISSSGKVMVTDDRAAKKIKGELSAAELSALNEQISALKDSFNQPDSRMCADCFIYDLDIQGKGKGIRAQLNDMTLSGSDFESLVTFLLDLMDGLLR